MLWPYQDVDIRRSPSGPPDRRVERFALDVQQIGPHLVSHDLDRCMPEVQPSLKRDLAHDRYTSSPGPPADPMAMPLGRVFDTPEGRE